MRKRILEAVNLSGGYGSRMVIAGLSISIQQGEWLSLVGANGSGKSTLLRLLCRILTPQSGHVVLEGQPLADQKTDQIARQVAMVPQTQRIPEGISVRQLVSLGRSPHQPWWQWQLDPIQQGFVDLALEQTGLISLAHRRVETLSGGERQRAFLALALAQNPKILVLDEPTTFLDLRYQLELLELLKRLNREQGLALITVLHDLNLAARFSETIALLQEGSLVARGSPEQVLTSSLLQQVFGLEAELIHTPVGLQICALRSIDVTIQSSSLAL